MILEVFVGVRWWYTVHDGTIQLLFKIIHFFFDLIDKNKNTLSKFNLKKSAAYCNCALVYTCSSASSPSLQDADRLRHLSSCSILNFSSSQRSLMSVSLAPIWSASPGVTNLNRASQSDSMWAKAALLSSKPSPTVCGRVKKGETNKEIHKIE